MKYIISVGLTALAAALVFWSRQGHSISKGDYVGVARCATCHSGEGMGDQVGKWRLDKHSRAYELLINQTKILNEIKARHKIPNPQLDQKCLRCHNTGGQTQHLEGVGCEACHGAAKYWYTYEKHGIGGLDKAVKFGMYPILGDGNIKTRQALCQSCHEPKLQLCIPTDPRKAALRKITIEQISYPFNHKTQR